MTDKMAEPKIEAYDGPAGGWGSAQSLTEILLREEIPVSGAALLMEGRTSRTASCACPAPGPSPPSR